MKERPKQNNTRLRLRNRKLLLEAANRLLKRNLSPTLEEVAEEAMVSRATIYRYFTSIESLLNEAGLDVAFPDLETLFAGGPDDPIERLILANRAVDAMIAENEYSLRHMLIHSLKHSLTAGEAERGVRQNRRAELIEKALGPISGSIPDHTAERLNAALALIIGTESMIVFKDVLGLDPNQAADAKQWAIEALVTAALQESGKAGSEIKR